MTRREQYERIEALCDARASIAKPDGSVGGIDRTASALWKNNSASTGREYGADKTGEPHIPASGGCVLPRCGGPKGLSRLPLAQAAAFLNYDPITGILTWKENMGPRARRGRAAGYLNDDGHIRVGVRGDQYHAHRIAWFIATGCEPAGEIDHINRNKADNRIKNLRDVPASVNVQNRDGATRSNVIGVRGVRKRRRKYQAVIQVGRERRSLGFFRTAEEAGAAYLAAKAKLHPGYVVHG